MKTYLAIPFSGFYNSIHSDNFDRYLEDYLPEDIDQDLKDEFIFEYSFNEKDLNDYCKEYVNKLDSELDCVFDLQFKELTMPREYNFETDRLFVQIDLCKLQALFNDINEDEFSELCKKRLTSYDGFISFYDPDFKTWGDLSDWDHNQLGLLFECYINENLNDDYDLYLMDDYYPDLQLNERQEEILKQLDEDLNDE